MNNHNLNEFKSISLIDLKNIQLMNRHDTKFVFNQNDLIILLKQLTLNYKILTINDCRSFNYKNLYFDTDNYLLYSQHHNEKRNRFKVRYRNYSTTNQSFFEIKTKNNKNRTIKNRIPVETINTIIGNKEQKLITKMTNISSEELKHKLTVSFSRITLADFNYNERLTIDTDLVVKNNITDKDFNNLVIAEIKQDRYNPKSPFIQILRNMKIQEMRFSKYCIGLLHVNDKIKYNRFKPKLLQINKIVN